MFGIKLNQTHWQRRLFLITGVAALWLSYPKFGLFYLAWIAPILFFFCLALTPIERSFRYGYFFGFLFHFISLYWISPVTGAGWIFAAFFQALYWGVFARVTRFLMDPILTLSSFRHRICFVVGAAGLWTALEWLRVDLPGFGFGWNLLSYSQTPFLSFIQVADLVGAYGISFLMMFISALGFCLLWDFYRRVKHWLLHGLFYLSLAVLLVVLALSYGYRKIAEPVGQKTLRVGVVQGNIPQEIKWDPEIKGKIIEKYAKLSELLLYDRPDMVIWPEAAYPGFLVYDYETSPVKKLIEDSKTFFLIGSPHYEKDSGKLYNSALWITPEGKLAGRYDKRSLVPFGEYIPFKKLFFFLEKIAFSFGVGDFVPGELWTVFEAPLDFKFATLVCFENIFPEITSELTRRGAQFFVIVTNDAWFKRTQAPYEHFYTSIFRAIETRRPFVHSANTGISGFIDTKGRVTGTLQDKTGNELFVSGGRTEPVMPQSGETVYVKYGAWLPLGALALALLAFLPVFFVRKFKNT